VLERHTAGMLFVYGLLGSRTRFSGHRIEHGYELKKQG
jgi:hypothetical protein